MTQSSDTRKANRLLGNTRIRTFEIVQYVSAPTPGGIDDWPANIQDAVWAALEKKAHDVELPLKIVHSYCAKDIDSTDPTRVWYLHIIASEIVASLETRH